MNWTAEELRRIVEADDLKVAPFREDGVTYGTPDMDDRPEIYN